MKVQIASVRESIPPLYELEAVCDGEPEELQPGTVLEVVDPEQGEGKE